MFSTDIICFQLVVKCKFCDKTMKRGYFSSMHDVGVDNDVQCLKIKLNMFQLN